MDWLRGIVLSWRGCAIYLTLFSFRLYLQPLSHVTIQIWLYLIGHLQSDLNSSFMLQWWDYKILSKKKYVCILDPQIFKQYLLNWFQRKKRKRSGLICMHSIGLVSMKRVKLKKKLLTFNLTWQEKWQSLLENSSSGSNFFRRASPIIRLLNIFWLNRTWTSPKKVQNPSTKGNNTYPVP